MYNNIKLEKQEEILVLTFNRPDKLNALNRDMLDEISQALDEIAADDVVKVLIVTGEGRAFVAGADIEHQSVLNEEGGLSWGEFGSGVFRRLETLEIPTIAAVNGFALGGGCELALSCDIILAADKARFGQPEVGLGITPGFSGTQRLPRRVGVGKAKQLLFSGDMINAVEAEKIGLADKVVPIDTLLDEAVVMAKSFTKNGSIAVKYCKKAVNEGMQVDIDSAIKIENEYFSKCFATHDQKEGMKAFLEKRPSVFQNK